MRLAFIQVKSRSQESNSSAVHQVARASRVEDLPIVTFRPETPPKVERYLAPFLEPSRRRFNLIGEQVLRSARFTRQPRVNRDRVKLFVHLPPGIWTTLLSPHHSWRSASPRCHDAEGRQTILSVRGRRFPRVPTCRHGSALDVRLHFGSRGRNLFHGSCMNDDPTETGCTASSHLI